MRPHVHHCPYCNKRYACTAVDCIDADGEEWTCPHCEYDLRDEDADQTDPLPSVQG